MWRNKGETRVDLYPNVDVFPTLSYTLITMVKMSSTLNTCSIRIYFYAPTINYLPKAENLKMLHTVRQTCSNTLYTPTRILVFSPEQADIPASLFRP
jgi:hypothetical protein